MRKEMYQIIKEAVEALPNPGLFLFRSWTVNVDDGEGNIITVNFVKIANVWHFTTLNDEGQK
ncbi:hypothetical protein [Bacteroides reticulotermitis]|uniref:Uncharacterized protein n=2 Tax=Bacteroides reticulotermitis TaxID=1133319 RepID=W4UTQ9_9BACE|nr:hypothetical protein [Bacteroides reticulotermitis]MBB4045314.1 hypothetical protein [Bacteroides reticulotermitis]GAE84207.1 hypothetical protein JCM10512_2536 [Bacteroides reticulotermitis JCM 10512]